MARTDSKWMPVYVADYLADTTHLSTLQHGAFLLLLFSYWRRGSKIPDSDVFLAQVARMPVKEWLAIRPVLAELFEVSGGWWTNKRLEIELAKAAAHTKAKAEAGAKGGQSRWQKHSTAMPTPLANESRTDTPLPSPSQSSNEDPSPNGDGGRKRPKRATALPDDWKPNERNLEDAKHRGHSSADIARIAEHFSDHHRAKGTTSKDWDASWRTWLANEKRFGARVSARKSASTDWDGALAAAQGPDELAADVRSAWDQSRVIDGEFSPSAGSGPGEPASVPAGGTGFENLDEGVWDSERGPGSRFDDVPQDVGTLAAGSSGLGRGEGYREMEVGIQAPDAGGYFGYCERGDGREDDAGLSSANGTDESDLDLPAFLDRRHKLSA